MKRLISFVLAVALATGLFGGSLYADGGGGADRGPVFSSSSPANPLNLVRLVLLAEVIIQVRLLLLLTHSGPFAYIAHFPQGASVSDAEIGGGFSLFGGGNSVDPQDLTDENRIGNVYRSGNALVVSRNNPGDGGDASNGGGTTFSGRDISTIAEEHASNGAETAGSANLGCKDADGKVERVRIANQDKIFELEKKGFKIVGENSELASLLKAAPLNDLFSDPIGEAFCIDGELLVIVNPSILAQAE